MGVADITSRLAHPKPVLFVGDDQTQIAEGDAVADQGVGTDDEIDLPPLQVLQDLPLTGWLD